MWSLCGGREGKALDEGGPSEDGVFSGSEAYRPYRGLAREMIDEQAMAPSAQVEMPAGIPRSNFTVGGARGGAAGAAAGWPGAGGPSGAPATLSAYNTANATGFRQGSGAGATSSGGGSSEVDAQSEILGEELKKEGNQLYNEGQLEAAELVYSEALKARTRRCSPSRRVATRAVPQQGLSALGAAFRGLRAPQRRLGAPRAAARAAPWRSVQSASAAAPCDAPRGPPVGSGRPSRAARSALYRRAHAAFPIAVRAQELHLVLQPLHVLRQARALCGALSLVASR